MKGGRWMRYMAVAGGITAVLLSCGTAFGSVATALYIRAVFDLADGTTETGYCEVWNGGEYQPVQKRGRVTAPSGVNLREKADARSTALKKLPRDTEVTVLSTDGEPVEIEGNKAPWYQVRSGDLEGYVFGGFIRIDETLAPGSYTYRPIDADPSATPRPLTGEVLMNTVIRPGAADPEISRKALDIYRNIHRLKYLPERKENAAGDAIERIARFGSTASDTIGLAWADIRSVRILDLIEGDIAPIIEVSSAEAAMLEKPSLACYAVERYPEGVVSLISYNGAYTSPGQLETLLRSFLKGKTTDTAPADAEWWYPVYDAAIEREFRAKALPDKVILLIYHVPD